MSSRNLANARKVRVAENDLATVYDVDSFLGKIKEQRNKWTFFQTGVWQAEVLGRKYLKVKISTIPAIVHGSSMSFNISGSEGRPIEVDVSYGPGSEQCAIATLGDLANARAKAVRWSDVLNEFAEICSFLRVLVIEHQNRCPKTINQKGGKDECPNSGR